jgi:hypothetical protein
MACSYNYPDPVDSRACRASISDQDVGVIFDEVAGDNEKWEAESPQEGPRISPRMR